MYLVFSILGMLGGLLCCVGDVLFDLKGKGNEKVVQNIPLPGLRETGIASVPVLRARQLDLPGVCRSRRVPLWRKFRLDCGLSGPYADRRGRRADTEGKSGACSHRQSVLFKMDKSVRRHRGPFRFSSRRTEGKTTRRHCTEGGILPRQ